VLAAALVVAAVVGIAFPTLFYPFGRDQGIHAFTALLAGDGHVLYRDVFSVKPPMTTVIHWLALELFGETMRAIRIMDLLIMTGTAVMLLFLTARHLKSLWLGAVAAIAFASYHFSNDYWMTAQTDGWSNLFLVAAVLLYSRSTDVGSTRAQAFYLCCIGVLVGLAFWLKYTAATVLVVFLSVHLARRLPWRKVFADGALVAAAFSACVGAGVAILAAMGALTAFWDIQLFLRSYAAQAKPAWYLLLSPILILGRSKFATALAMLGLYAVYKSLEKRRHVPECIGLVAWLGAGWAAGLLQGKAIVYHLLPLLPPLAITAAIGVQAAGGALRRFATRDLARPVAAAACVLIVGFSNVPTIYRETGAAFAGGPALRDYWESDYFRKDNYDTGDNLALADYLRQHTLRCDPVFIWGFVPIVYFLSERRPVSRFLYSFPMMAAYYKQAYRDELIAALAATPPTVIVVEHEDRGAHIFVHNHDSAEMLERITELNRFVAERYILRDRVARFDVYYRKDAAPAARRRCPEADTSSRR
jgi:hypothetical protein